MSKIPHPLNILTLTVSLAIASPSWAQNDQQALEETLVYGEQGKTDTATKLDLTVFETPQSITSISRIQIEDFDLTNVNKLLDYVPGVTVEEIETDRTYYTARGFDIVNFQYDGVGIPFISGLNLGQQDSAIYEKVDVVKGAAGLITGLANPSATINFIRKRPTEDLRHSNAIGVSEWQGRRLDADLSGPLSEKVRGRAVVAYDKSESYLDRHEDESKIAYGILEFDLSASTLLTVGHSYDNSHSDGVLWGALPLLYTDGTPTDYDVSTSNAPDWTFADNIQHQTFVELEQKLGNDWTLSANFFRNKSNYESELFYVSGTPDPDTELGLNGLASAYEREENLDNADLFLSGSFALGGQTHQLVIGYNYADTDITEASYYDPVNGNPVLGSDWAEGNSPRPNFTDFDPATGATDISYKQKAFYVASRLNLLDKLSVLLGARATEFEQSGISYGGDAEADADETVPYYGITYQALDDIMLYASYSEVFKQQTWVDENLQPLGPTMGKSKEAGIKKSFNDERSLLTLAIFSSEQNNYGAFIDRNIDGVAYYEGTTVESKGYEIEFSGELTEGLNIGAGYTKIDIEDENGNTSRPFIPTKTLKLSTSYKIPALEGLKVGGIIRWQDDISTPSELVEQEAYTLLDLAVHYQLNESVGLSVNLENVTDEKYFGSLYWEQSFYGAPRNISASVRWSY